MSDPWKVYAKRHHYWKKTQICFPRKYDILIEVCFHWLRQFLHDKVTYFYLVFRWNWQQTVIRFQMRRRQWNIFSIDLFSTAPMVKPGCFFLFRWKMFWYDEIAIQLWDSCIQIDPRHKTTKHYRIAGKCSVCLFTQSFSFDKLSSYENGICEDTFHSQPYVGQGKEFIFMCVRLYWTDWFYIKRVWLKILCSTYENLLGKV